MARAQQVEAARQRPPAEEIHADELAGLRAADTAPRPPGWALSLQGVKRFICGEGGRGGKAVCAPALVERAMVTLATSRALLLVGSRARRRACSPSCSPPPSAEPRRSSSRAAPRSPRTRSATAGITLLALYAARHLLTTE